MFYKKRITTLKSCITPTATEPPQPLPAPTGQPPYRLDLSSILSTPPPTDNLVFHMVGDIGGVKDPYPQEHVADAMEQDCTQAPGALIPQFMYVVGDVIYFNGEDSQYYSQFYDPYVHYPPPIFAIPGNHDGEPLPGNATPSLQGFMTNFCAPAPVITPDAQDIPRTAMTQPNCYWTLTSPLATIVGLYSNVPEGGYVDATQTAWFTSELQAAPTDRALIVTVHHPAYSLDQYHSGSQIIQSLIDNAANAAARFPDAVFAGHVHNYQHFERTVNGKVIPYFVIGNGGYHNLHQMQQIPSLPYNDTDAGVTLVSCDDSNFGYIKMQVSKTTLNGTQYSVTRNGTVTPNDTFTYPLNYQ